MRFTIWWSPELGEYRVSISNYHGGEVVEATEYDRLREALRRIVEHETDAEGAISTAGVMAEDALDGVA